MLHAHVLDLGEFERAVFLGFAERVAGDVRMDVDLERFVVLADDEAVADAVEIETQRLERDVGRGFADDKDRVEGKGDILRIELGKVCLLVYGGGLVRDDVVALQAAEHALEDNHEAHAARVDNAGLFEHGILVDGIVQRGLRHGDGGGEDGFDAAILCGKVARGIRRKAGDREDRALGGLHDGLIGGLDAGGQRGGKIAAVGLLQALERLGKAAEQQREDDAGIAARTAQQRGGRDVGGFGERDVRLAAKLGRGCAEGHAHVGAGVAVRHGENVQFVDLLLFKLDGSRGGADHAAKGRAVKSLSQKETPPWWRTIARGLINGNGVDKDVDGPDLGTGGLCDEIADLLNDGGADGADVDALVHHDVQINRDLALFVEGDLDALAHGLAPEQVDQSVGH